MVNFLRSTKIADHIFLLESNEVIISIDGSETNSLLTAGELNLEKYKIYKVPLGETDLEGVRRPDRIVYEN